MKFFLTFVATLLLTLSLRAENSEILRNSYISVIQVRPLPKEEYFAWAQTFEAFGNEKAVTDMTENLQGLYFRCKNLSPYAIEDLVKNFPKTDDLYNTLAWSLYLSEQDATKAYQMIQKIEQFESHSRDSYAMILLRMGKPAEALQQILQVISEFRFTDGSYHTLVQYCHAIVGFSHAGDIFYRNNLYQEAFLAWGKAYNLANSLIQQQVIAEDILFLSGYNHQQTKAKLRALKKRHNLFNNAPEA